ncbi:40S ribosomal protein S16-1 [Durusdinium trenchii]|uniref:40S ribosomal protein S16-1 n=1 Tax=Durusdinium trenchii TaxID=1381693 RepID=A0ABP0J5I1_9DINO
MRFAMVAMGRRAAAMAAIAFCVIAHVDQLFTSMARSRSSRSRSARQAQMLPALQPREEKTRNIYRLKSDSDLQELVEVMVSEASVGLGTDSLGLRAANLAVKACATAGKRFEREILVMAPQWISKTAHGRALDEGEMEIKALRIFYGLTERDDPPQQKPLLVGRTTNIGQLAGALLRRIQELDEAVLHVAGAERTMAALKAVITAQRLLEAEDIETKKQLLVSPSWRSDGPRTAYLRLRCFIALQDAEESSASSDE